MPHDWWTRKHLIFMFAFVSLACVVALVAAGLTEPFPGVEIGPDWQCSRLAFVFTVCSPVSQADRAFARVSRERVCRRPRV
jgi:hypothetical protein